MRRLFSYLILCVATVSTFSCADGSNDKTSTNADSTDSSTDKAVFTLFELRKHLSRCDHLELVYYTPQGTITTENTSQAEIIRFATYIAEGGSPADNCESEGLVIFRRNGEMLVEMDYAIKHCSYMKVKMGGVTYKQFLNEEGEHFFSQFSQFK